MNYDELVKALNETDFAEGCPCDAEKLCKDGACIILQAADAIEELQKRLSESIPKSDAEIIISEVAKPRWISVKKRLPEEGTFVLVFTIGGTYGQLAWLDIDRYINGRFYGGQYETANPVAWMPLPTPPKEDADAV